MSDIEWMFYHLWFKLHMKVLNTSDSDELDVFKERMIHTKVSKFPFKIPETIILTNGKIDSWYFKSKEGVILK